MSIGFISATGLMMAGSDVIGKNTPHMKVRGVITKLLTQFASSWFPAMIALIIPSAEKMIAVVTAANPTQKIVDRERVEQIDNDRHQTDHQKAPLGPTNESLDSIVCKK